MVYAYWFHSNFNAARGRQKRGYCILHHLAIIYLNRARPQSSPVRKRARAPSFIPPTLCPRLLEKGKKKKSLFGIYIPTSTAASPFNNLLGIFIRLEIYWFVPSKNLVILWTFSFNFFRVPSWPISSFSFYIFTLRLSIFFFFFFFSFFCSVLVPLLLLLLVSIDVFEFWPLFAQHTGHA